MIDSLGLTSRMSARMVSLTNFCIRVRKYPKLTALFRAVVIWLGEVSVGLLPLYFDLISHFFINSPYILARCEKGFLGCVEVVDSVDAEKCILTVVLSGLALVPDFLDRPLRGTQSQITLHGATALGVLVIMVTGGLLYGAITSGINRNTDGIVGLLLIGALCGSLLLTIDRSLRECQGPHFLSK